MNRPNVLPSGGAAVSFSSPGSELIQARGAGGRGGKEGGAACPRPRPRRAGRTRKGCRCYLDDLQLPCDHPDHPRLGRPEKCLAGGTVKAPCSSAWDILPAGPGAQPALGPYSQSRSAPALPPAPRGRSLGGPGACLYQGEHLGTAPLWPLVSRASTPAGPLCAAGPGLAGFASIQSQLGGSPASQLWVLGPEAELPVQTPLPSGGSAQGAARPGALRLRETEPPGKARLEGLPPPKDTAAPIY